ncbi:hypothetical protein BsWGS_24334 [Bradybaena similaris]
MTFRKSLACGLQKSVGSLWKEDDYSDFTVVVEGTSFKCHRFILSACSGFFRGLFKSQMKELLESRASLEGMTVKTFETIINALYTGTDRLNNDNVLDLWSAAEFLQINYLTKECHTFVMKNISVDSCFRFLDHATLYAAQNVIDHSLDFISRQFKNVTDKDNILRLPFEHFYKVIAHDYLAIDCEELAVDMVLKWVKYDPQSTQGASLDSANNTEGIDDAHDEQSDNDSSTNSLSNSGNQENIDADQTMLSRDKKTIMPVKHNTVSKDYNNDRKQENRKHHLAQLLSACRLFTIKAGYLGNVMKTHIDLLVDTGAYTLLHEALMYNVDVGQRHDTWPKAAVHRASSSSKHVMVFECKNIIMAYDLNTGSCTEFAKVPREVKYCAITIFDNNLYLLCRLTNELYMRSKQNIWEKITKRGVAVGPMLLLPHGNNIYNLYSYQDNTSLYRLCCAQGHSSIWSLCEKLDTNPNCLIRFHKYILLISMQNVITVQCYNTETQKIHTCTASMDGTSENMTSFRNGEDVYLIQRNGSLWKVFSRDETPLDFELVSKLWDFDCNLKGCVLYRKKLFIFCDDNQSKPMLTKLPGIFAKLVIVKVDSKTPCLPMIIHSY